MTYANLTNSLGVSSLCLGTMMFGGQTGEAESRGIMDFALDNGINFWDTANAYNGGESERIVGLGMKGRRQRVILATKVANPMHGPGTGGLSRSKITEAADASLKRLDTDYIDIYYLHHPDNNTPLQETLEAMSGLAKAGKIRYIGVSNYPAWQIADMLNICEKRDCAAPIITQNVYNLLTRGVETELIPFLSSHNISMSVYNPLAGGLLSGKHRFGSPQENTRFSNNRVYYNRYWSETNFKAVGQLEKIALDNNLSLLELALKWCIGRENVTSVITGVSRLSQLQQNIAALDAVPLSESVLKSCDELWRTLSGDRFSYIN